MYQAIQTGNYNPTLRDLDKAGIEIFNDWWTTYIPEHKSELIRKIMHTYYLEQIGAETVDQFIHYINAQLERIMPYYNQLYASELIKIDPLLNHSIEANGRSIENLLTKANTTDDKFAKAIRDFAGVTDKSGTQDVIGHITGNTHRADIGHETYTKDGTENISDKRDTIGTEDESTHETKITDGTVTKTEIEKTTIDDTRDLNKSVTEQPNEQTIKEMKWGQSETGTEKVVGQDNSSGTGTRNWTETKDDDATTHTVTELDETSSGSSEKDYADTPQKQLDVTSEYGTAHVRRDYLTNVTWNSENSKHNANTTQDVDFKDDETKEHTEDTTDKNTTDKTQNTDTTRQKGGTDIETTTHTGTNVTDTTERETQTRDQNRNLNANTTQHETVNTDVTRDLNTTEKETATRDKNWTENGESNSTLNSTTTTSTDSTSNSQSTGTEQSRETSDLSQSSIATQERTSEETADKGTSNITSGFMNVSASALLEAFRRTFLNIDSLIIEELRDNFMLVY